MSVAEQKSGDGHLQFGLYDVDLKSGELRRSRVRVHLQSQLFAQPNDLVTFFDNHDSARIMTLGADKMGMKQAIAFLLTCRGAVAWPIFWVWDRRAFDNLSM